MVTTMHRPYGEVTNLSQILAHEARLNRLHLLFKTHFDVTEPSLVLAPYLFLGNCISAHDIYRLSRLGIRYILNVAKRDVELCPYYSSDIRTLTIDLRDDDRENILRTFDEAFAFIDEARRVNSRILVHCSHGQSRSPTIVIGYLMRTYNVSLEQCLIHVVKSRPCVIPNDGFLKQLIVFDRFLVERRQQQQQQAVAKQVVNTATPTEIPIQPHSSDTPELLPPSSPDILTSPECSDVSISVAVNTSTLDSISTDLSSTSTTQTSITTDSIQVIPIQIPLTDPVIEKFIEIAPVPDENVPTDNDSTGEYTNKSLNKLEELAARKLSKISNKIRLENSSSYDALLSKKKSNAVKAINTIELPSQVRRCVTDDLDCPNVNYRNNLSVRLTQQQWNFINSYPTNHHGSIEHTPTNYITEIYDRATNRFVPATYCY